MTTALPDIDPALPATDPAAMNKFNRLLIDQFRACRGRLTGQLAGAPVLLLTTVGAKSGQAHTTPLGFVRDGRRYVVAASKAGAPTNPDWYCNLLANPAATVETGTETFAAHSTIADGEERIRLFKLLAAQWPMQLGYQQKTTRRIPVVILERPPQTNLRCNPLKFSVHLKRGGGSSGSSFIGQSSLVFRLAPRATEYPLLMCCRRQILSA